MAAVGRLAEPLLEMIYPERCVLCGAAPEAGPWTQRGPRVAGLRFWDATHLCRDCAAGLNPGTVAGTVGAADGCALQVVAAGPTHPAVVQLVGRFKYHGVRGLAWPLARLLRAPLRAACAASGHVDLLVPVALHARRRRVRGFNQAEVLARLLAAEADLAVAADVLVRRRHTGQQAKLKSVLERRRNLAACFAARPAAGSAAGGVRVGLVDDLVTSGWTALSAARALGAAGWDVKWVLALGLAVDRKNPGGRVDTRGDGF